MDKVLLLVLFLWCFIVSVLSQRGGGGGGGGIQQVKLQAEKISRHHINKRKVILFETHSDKQWPTEVPYYIEPSHFPRAEELLLMSVMRDDFEAHTCLRFVGKTTPPPFEDQYIYFRHNDNDTTLCKAYIGMQDDSRTYHGQPIYLGDYCFQYRGTIIYMIASTLGLYGEVKRPDRDAYVDIFRENIEPGGLQAFVMESTDAVHTHDVPYDYGSAMHPAARDWLSVAANVDPSAFAVLPKDRRYGRSIGQKSEISFYDLMAINRAYCSDICDNSGDADCKNGGYQDPNNCGHCKCPDGFSGRYCHEIKEGTNLCSKSSGELPVTEEIKCVASRPNYNLQTYDFGDECTWLLRAPAGKRIDAWFTNLYLPSYGTGFTPCLHWVEIKHKGPDAVRGPRYCNNGSFPNHPFRWSDVNSNFSIPNFSNPITSTGGQMMVLFRAPDYRGVNTPPYFLSRKFELCYRISSALPDVIEPTTGNPRADEQTEDKSDNNNNLLIIGAVVGALLLILIILVLILICCVYRRKKRRTPPPSPQPNIQVAYVNPGYGASNAVRMSSVYSNLEIDCEKKDPDSLDFSQVGNPGYFQPYPGQFVPPPEYEEHKEAESENKFNESFYSDAKSVRKPDGK